MIFAQKQIALVHCIIHQKQLMKTTPHFYYPNRWWLLFFSCISVGLYSSIIFFLHAIVFAVIISMGFVHREHLIWERVPYKNLLWVSGAFFL